MKNVIRVMAKEVRRVRALAEMTEKHEAVSNRLKGMKRMLALLIKAERKST